MKKCLYFFILLMTNNVVSQEKKCVEVYDSISKSRVFETVDIMPQPKKGVGELQKKVREAIVISDSVQAFSSIRAIVEFIVCEDGNLDGQRVLFDTTDFQLGQQLLSVATSLEWEPGKCSNEAVRVIYKLPLIIDVR